MVAPTRERMEALKTRIVRPASTFLDLDGTTTQGQLLIEFMLKLGECYPERSAVLDRLRTEITRYETHRTYDYSPVLREAIAAITPLFTGLAEADVRALGRQFVRDLVKRTYLFPRVLLSELSSKPIEERGLIVAISGSPRELTEPFGEILGFDLVYGMEYEVDEDGLYTGRYDERTVHAKGVIVDEVVAFFGLDLGWSIGLGDSFSDAPMLDRVGYPLALNPQRRLLEHVRKNRRMVWVNDRQKNGVTMFRPDERGSFHQINPLSALPGFVGRLPGITE